MRRMLMIFLFVAVTLLPAQTVDSQMNAKIRAEAFQHSQAAEVYNTLTLDIGPRLTASPAFKRAVNFVRERLTSYGLANVHLEPFPFPYGRGWTLNQLTLEMVEPRYTPLIGYAEAWSPSTAGELTGTPIYLGDKTPAEIEAMKSSLKGAIVMALPKQTEILDEDRPQPTAPGVTAPESLTPPPLFRNADQKSRNVLRLVEAAGAGVILRPNVLTGGTVYVTGRDLGAAGVPSVILSTEQYNVLAGMMERHLPVKLKVNLQSTYNGGESNVNNVIAEIPGTDPALRNQVVMLGAHLDSWHTATGASDNADGVATMIEAMRILKAVGAKPRRTIRVGIWGGEEQGLLGSRAYVRQHLTGDTNKSARDNFAAYFNIDNGTGPIYGFAMENNEGAKPYFDAWLAPFKDLGARKNVNLHLTATDHQSFLPLGVPAFNPFQDYKDYDLRTHHTNMDLGENVHPEDITKAAIVMASFAWHTAMLDQLLPRK